MKEKCAICGCPLHRTKGTYARPTVLGRSHASKHHHVAERFFGRSANRKGVQRKRVFDECSWEVEGNAAVFCYDCHELLLHNPVLLPHDIDGLAELVQQRGFAEKNKPKSMKKLAGRIVLFHEVIEAGLEAVLNKESKEASPK